MSQENNFFECIWPPWVNIFIHHSSCYTKSCGYRTCNIFNITCSLPNRLKGMQKDLHCLLSYTICPIEVTAKQDWNFYYFCSFSDSMQRAREMTWIVKYLPHKYGNLSLLAPQNPRDKNHVLWCMHVSALGWHRQWNPMAHWLTSLA